MLILIAREAASWKEYAARLQRNGLFCYRCGYETALFLCDKKDTGGVILDCTDHLQKGQRLCHALREQYPDMPIAAVVKTEDVPDLPATRIIRCDSLERLPFDALADFGREICGLNTKRLCGFFLTVSEDPSDTRYMGYPMPLSGAQHTILRFLLYRAPLITPIDDILELCFPNGNTSVRSLTSQLHAINRRARLIDPRPLIESVYGKGYRLRDGIL